MTLIASLFFLPAANAQQDPDCPGETLRIVDIGTSPISTKRLRFTDLSVLAIASARATNTMGCNEFNINTDGPAVGNLWASVDDDGDCGARGGTTAASVSAWTYGVNAFLFNVLCNRELTTLCGTARALVTYDRTIPEDNPPLQGGSAPFAMIRYEVDTAGLADDTLFYHITSGIIENDTPECLVADSLTVQPQELHALFRVNGGILEFQAEYRLNATEASVTTTQLAPQLYEICIDVPASWRHVATGDGTVDSSIIDDISRNPDMAPSAIGIAWDNQIDRYDLFEFQRQIFISSIVSDWYIDALDRNIDGKVDNMDLHDYWLSVYLPAAQTNPSPDRCIADMNLDGELTGADFNSWLSAFSSGLPLADSNGDGALTGSDQNAWITAYAVGCE